MTTSLVIEAWINPLSALTPSLVVHNLELQGIQLPQPFTMTVDRGHYDCMDTNYAVITVEATSPIRLPACTPQSFCCSFFSHSVTRSMDPGALYPHWLGNCYMHWGYTCEAGLCSYRHEAGRAKTWNLAESVSVDPVYKKNTKDPKDHVRIVQLQKKTFLLRTELDAWKAEVMDLKAELSTVKAELSTVKAEAQRHKERHKELRDNYADMPALDLIANHYAIPDAAQAPAQAPAQAQAPDSSGDDDDDDDCFIQVVVEK